MYKKAVSLALIVALSLGLVGCATVQVEAPGGTEIKLATEDTTTYKRIVKKRVFYALWGLVPLTPNSTASMVNPRTTHEIKVKSYYNVVDFLISAVLGTITITSRTVEIQIVN